MPSEPTVSIVIPAYNEGGRLPHTLETLAGYARDHREINEIIVVDDGSRDDTSGIARQYAQRNSHFRLMSYWPNAGKGYAIRRGVMEARGHRILLTDADLSTPIEELPKLTAELADADIAIGSRAVDESLVRVKQAWPRRAMGKSFNRIVRMITGLPYRDTQCGFKLLSRDVAAAIFSEAVVDRFAWDVEMLMLAHLHGYTVAEVPVLWFNSPASRVHVIRDSMRMLRDTARIVRRLGRVKPAAPR